MSLPAAALIAAARGLVTEMAGRASASDRAGALPTEDLAALREAGLLGLFVPERLGGGGARFSDYVEVALALGEGNGATALIFNMHASATGALALTPDALASALGAPASWFEARDELLGRALSGERFAVAMSERGAGSRLSALATTYASDGGGYRITGEKAFVSGAAAADHLLVAARAESDVAVVSHFVVPAGPGVEVHRSWDALGMRASASDDVSLDVHVGPGALLGGREGLALLVARVLPQWLVASYAAVYVGVARAAIGAARAHLRERHLAGLPAVRLRVGRADAEVAAAGALVREAGRMVDEHPGERETNRAVYRAKLVAGEVAQQVAASMLEAAGAGATRAGHPLERLYRDARCGALQPATSDVCADWLGIAALGGDPDADAEVPRW